MELLGCEQCSYVSVLLVTFFSMAKKRLQKGKSRKRRSPEREKEKNGHISALGRRLGVNAVLFLALVAILYVLYLDSVIRYEFEGKRWALPAHVYARPLELFPGMHLTAEQLIDELTLLGYRANLVGGRPGSYSPGEDEVRIISRPFNFWDSDEQSLFFRARFRHKRLTQLYNLRERAELPLVRLDPYRFATISPSHHEDRVLVQGDRLPSLLVKALIAVEDRQFYGHHGLDARGIARALWANIKAMGVVQGGSTLTQQLIKNYFLSRDRTISRKLKEAAMALLIELHYDKGEILEAYCNEVYLGQDGRRAIHGFGLAARFFFGAPLEELRLPDLALLVGLVKGPSYFDPRRHPERARKRRDQVLTLLAEQDVITASEARQASEAPLGVTPRGGGSSRFPAFLGLVRSQIKQDYREEDLRSEGLQVFTTLDPLAQFSAERALSGRLAQLDSGGDSDPLQGAVVVTNTGNGEVLAVVGDRKPHMAGFNRALVAERQVGSLIKPAVYLTALAHGQYTLLSPVDDGPLSVEVGSGEPWRPRNFDQQHHDLVPLYRGLAESLNVATVRLGLDLGVKKVINTLRELGIKRELPPYPSLFLGAVELTPLEVTQMYQTLAGGGFVTPLRAIRAVMSADGQPLHRYALEVRQTVDPLAVYLTNVALQEVVRSGTARRLSDSLSSGLGVAGKTGTTNELRDSWFAGFVGDRLAVVWVGRDNNAPSGLTGAGGAMGVWADTMAHIDLRPLALMQPADIEWVWVDAKTFQASTQRCADAIKLPFVTGTAPADVTDCGANIGAASINKTVDWIKGILE